MNAAASGTSASRAGTTTPGSRRSPHPVHYAGAFSLQVAAPTTCSSSSTASWSSTWAASTRRCRRTSTSPARPAPRPSPKEARSTRPGRRFCPARRADPYTGAGHQRDDQQRRQRPPELHRRQLRLPHARGRPGAAAGETYEIAMFGANRHPTESSYQSLTASRRSRSSCSAGAATASEAGASSATAATRTAAPTDPLLRRDHQQRLAYGGCTTLCKLGPHCGDGVVDPAHEECDLGSKMNNTQLRQRPGARRAVASRTSAATASSTRSRVSNAILALTTVGPAHAAPRTARSCPDHRGFRRAAAVSAPLHRPVIASRASSSQRSFSGTPAWPATFTNSTFGQRRQPSPHARDQLLVGLGLPALRSTPIA